MRATDIRLFSSDLDGTLVGNADATRRFAEAWADLPAGTRPLLVYNTGRTVADTLQLVAARGLPEPDYVIGSLGTELYDSLYRDDVGFRARFVPGWDFRTVDRVVGSMPDIKRQSGDCVHEFKSSWYWVRARNQQIDELRRQLHDAGVRAMVVYSCRYFLDVIPAAAGKGNALRWLCAKLGVPLRRVLVAGDTGNDNEMFALPGVNAIAVGNALPELLTAATDVNLFVANAGFADGVVEGLARFGVLPAEAVAREEEMPPKSS